MGKLLSWIWTLFWLLASGVIGGLFYESYWRWRGCFDAEGRCWVGDVVHHDQSVFLALPLAVCVLAAVAGLVASLRRRR